MYRCVSAYALELRLSCTDPLVWSVLKQETIPGVSHRLCTWFGCALFILWLLQWQHTNHTIAMDLIVYPNYIFIRDLTPGFNGLGKGNCKTRRETFIFWDLVRFILEDWQWYGRIWGQWVAAKPQKDETKCNPCVYIAFCAVYVWFAGSTG